MKKEKGVDLKIKIDIELLKWFLNESESFYLLIDNNGNILSFSENSLIFFSLKSDYELGKYSISKYIGDENWQLLLTKINNIPNNEEKYLILPEQVNSIYPLGVKWKSYIEEDKNRIFLIIKHIFTKSHDNEDIEFIETEKENEFNLNYYKGCLDFLDIPVAILKNNNFLYKNKQFEYFVQNENIYDYNSLLDWIKNYSLDSDINIETLDNNFITEIKKDDIYYKYISNILFKDEQIFFIYLLKSEKEKQIEIAEKEKINIIDKKEKDQNNKYYNIINKLNDIKLEFQNEYNNLTNNFNFDLKSVFNKINDNYTEYEEIITYTSESLINMSKNFNFIEDISVKIHLISINAAIESAKSGEQGRGFAVIAREIAKLSTEIKDYTKKIGNQIKNINEYTKKTTIKEERKSIKSLDEFKNITDLLESIKSKITDTTYSIKEKINNLLLKE